MRKEKVKIILLNCIFCVLIVACKNDHQVPREKNKINIGYIDSAKHLLQTGDIVFRRGSDAISDIFSKFAQQDNTYSHCGIALQTGDTIAIYHSLGGEDNPDAKIRKENLYDFVNPQTNNGFGIVRFNFTPMQLHKLDSITKLWYAQHIMFDNDFDLQSNDRMYCAEFVYKAVQLAVGDSNYFALSHIKSFTYVAPDNILLHKNASRIYEKMYK